MIAPDGSSSRPVQIIPARLAAAEAVAVVRGPVVRR
ncbi:hypothetical protein J2S55_006108 [Streptosporangium brasiliense]|uniref:Uncharacterized protein n=1 Tax=Streptosporangium brasiliense TaxID=47480 RepID=A0ABT9RDA9_9ACTN|nr:hypothetical protein [Streptosporangium brasiliense]